MSTRAAFWDDRFDAPDFVYGTAPNAFVHEEAPRWLSPPQDVLDLGAGEGRNAVFLAQLGHRVTAADFSREGLRKTRRLAAEAGVDVQTLHVDAAQWAPDRTWDAVVVTFLHLPPGERPSLYRRIRAALRPGGVLLAEWFRPAQVTGGYDSGGPPSAEMMVTTNELRAHFASEGIAHLADAQPTLDEGPRHQGPAATVRFVWRKPEHAEAIGPGETEST